MVDPNTGRSNLIGPDLWRYSRQLFSAALAFTSRADKPQRIRDDPPKTLSEQLALGASYFFQMAKIIKIIFILKIRT
jgi:hypothetical protein